MIDQAIFIVGATTLAALGLVALTRLLGALGRLPRQDVSGRWVMVTGCDSGFGAGVVSALSGRGAHVIAFCLTEDGGARARDEGAREVHVVDLTDESKVDEAIERVRRQCGGQLWGLVHNAGVVQPGFVEYLTDEVYRRVMEVNFFAPVRMTRALLPEVQAARGRVVLVSSVDGIVSLPGNAPYDASKFALEGYADALRVEQGFFGVGVSVVNPATMRTPLAMTFFEGHRTSWDQMNEQDPEGSWRERYTQEWLDEYVTSNTQGLERIAQDPRHAIDDITHALTAKRPRSRYLSGHLARTLFYGLWVAPESWAHAFKVGMVQPRPNRPDD